jgi:hypothetical protein
MTQKSPSKQFLLDPIENHRNIYQLTKTSMANLTPIQNSIGINTELHRDIGINTPNYAEQTTRDIDKGNTVEEVPEIFMEGTREFKLQYRIYSYLLLNECIT